jgi:hypothetical protein
MWQWEIDHLCMMFPSKPLLLGAFPAMFDYRMVFPNSLYSINIFVYLIVSYAYSRNINPIFPNVFRRFGQGTILQQGPSIGPALQQGMRLQRPPAMPCPPSPGLAADYEGCSKPRGCHGIDIGE